MSANNSNSSSAEGGTANQVNSKKWSTVETLRLSEQGNRLENIWLSQLFSSWTPADCVSMHDLIQNMLERCRDSGFKAMNMAMQNLELHISNLLPGGNFPSVEQREEINAAVYVVKAEIKRVLEYQTKGVPLIRTPANIYGEQNYRLFNQSESTENRLPLVYLVDNDGAVRKQLPLHIREKPHQ